MSVLVTGACGYLGSHTCLALLEVGYEVVAVDNLCNSSRESLKRVSELTGQPFKLYECDVRNGMQLMQVVEQNNVEAVIHFAALKSVSESFEKPLEYYENNVGGTLTLLRVMALQKVPYLVFSSSATVYGEQEVQPVHESASLRPCSPYGRTKVTCEEMIEAAARANADFSAVILRYFNPVGAHESGRIGEAPQGEPSNLLPRLTRAAAGSLPPLVIAGDDFPTPDGTGLRDYVHVCDIAQGHVAALEALERRPSGVLTCNLGAGRPVSVRELIDTFERATGVSVPCRVGPRREGDLAACWADITRARLELGWSPLRTMEEACRDAWNWQSQNPFGYVGPVL